MKVVRAFRRRRRRRRTYVGFLDLLKNKLWGAPEPWYQTYHDP